MANKKNKLKTGKLLLAEPFMADPNFKRTVSLMCAYNKQGAMALVLNRELENTLAEALPELSAFDGPLYYGGPVGADNTLHFLHRRPDLINGGQKIVEGLYWGGDFEQIKSLIKSYQLEPKDIRFYLGYSGWDLEQIREEIKENSWIIAKAEPVHVFSDPESLWPGILQTLGDDFKIMANFPENPLWN